MECHFSKKIPISERTSQEDYVPVEASSDIDYDNISNTKSVL